jgi:hypothetical protein
MIVGQDSSPAAVVHAGLFALWALLTLMLPPL